MSSTAISVLVSFLGRPKDGGYLSDGQLSFNCPRCRDQNYGQWDGKHNLDITFPGARGRPPLIASCWKCGYASAAGQLVREYAPPELYRQWRAYEDSLPPGMRGASRAKAKRAAELPEDFERMREQSADPMMRAAWHYLTAPWPEGRGVPPARVHELGFGISREPRWVNRVMMPCYDAAGELNFVIGRHLWEQEGIPPYTTTFGVKRTEIIANEHRIDWNQPVTVVEGMFDYAAYPHNTVMLLGKSLYPGGPLEQRLRHYRPPLIVGVDMDAAGTGKLLLEPDKPDAKAKKDQTMVVRAAESREAMLQRTAELGLDRRFWLELPHNDLGKVMQVEGAHAVPRIVQQGIRADKFRDVGLGGVFM